jgi:hypothetical protein
MGKNQHVVRHPEGWAVKGEGNRRATVVTTTQAEAKKFAREIAKKQESELLIHGKEGKLWERSVSSNRQKVKISLGY